MSTEIIDIQRCFQRRGFSVYRPPFGAASIGIGGVIFDRDIQAQF